MKRLILVLLVLSVAVPASAGSVHGAVGKSAKAVAKAAVKSVRGAVRYLHL